MHSVSDVLDELRGNGFTQQQLFDISKELTEFTISKKRIYNRLVNFFDDEELDGLLITLQDSSFEDEFMAKVFKILSPAEKERYLMHTVDKRSVRGIAAEQGVSKGTVQTSIERARQKIEKLKREQLKC